MPSLAEELQGKIRSIDHAIELTNRVLLFIPDMASSYADKRNYRIYKSRTGGTTRYVRPLNLGLFILDSSEFLLKAQEFRSILHDIKTTDRTYSLNEKKCIDQVVYTMQQAFSVGMDLLINSNAAKKHVGNRFEELIRIIFSDAGVTNAHETLAIPYGDPENPSIYKCENDIILSPFSEVRSSVNHLDPNEVIVSLKTSSKDRMGKIFIDKMLLENFVGHKQPVIGIFLNDVQRKGDDNISFTLVSGLFMVYTQFLIQLDGIYYLDLPPNALIEPWKDHISTFSTLLTEDIKVILSTP